MSDRPLLEVEDLVTRLRRAARRPRALVHARHDEILAVIGANGVGKTTLLNALVGQLPLWSGRVLLDGKRVSGLAPHRLVRGGDRARARRGGACSRA